MTTTSDAVAPAGHRPSPGHQVGPDGLIRWALRRQWRWIAVGASAGVVWMAGFAAAPALVGLAIDDAIDGANGTTMTLWAVALATITIVAALAGALRHHCAISLWANTGLLSEGHLSGRVLDRSGGIDNPAGELLSLAVGDANRVAAIADLTNRTAGAIVSLVVVSIWLIATSVSLGLIVLIAVPASAALLVPFLSRYDTRATAERRALAAASAAAADGISGLRTAHGLGGGPQVRSWFRAHSTSMRSTALSLVRLEATLFSTVGFIPWLTLVPVFWIGGGQAIDGEISPGTFVTVVGLAQFLRIPVANLGEAFGVVIAGRASARRITTVAASPVAIEPTEPRGASTPSVATLEIDRLHVDGAGPIELRATSGETVGIVFDRERIAAAFTDVLARTKPPRSGDVYVHGADLFSVQLPDLPNRLRVVDTERPWLLSSSLLENLRLARAGLRAEDAIDLLRAAACDDIIARPDAIHRVIGERGLQLSGGQRQRVAVAQALASETDVLVVIEPTSALDAVTEATLADRFFARPRPTTLLLSRSPQILSRCDRVVFIEDGRVSRTGAHHELADTDPAYRSLVLGAP